MPPTGMRAAGTALIVSAVLGVATAVATVAAPPAVPRDQWSYPFSGGLQWAVSIVLAVAHLLTLLGVLAVRAAGPTGRSRTAGAAIWVAAGGLAVLTVAELLSGAIGRESVDSSGAAAVGTVFGVGGVLTALGCVVAGVFIVRERRWLGAARWGLLVSGLVLALLVMPLQAAGVLVATTVALLLWSLAFLPVGAALRSTVRTSTGDRSSALADQG
jgi:hypothetical protein